MAEKTQPVVHSEDEWREHLDLIARLYIVDCLSHEQIADHLATSLDFPTSGSTVKKWLLKWKIARFNPQDELKLMASYSLFYRQMGQNVTFRRFGEDVPPDKVAGYLQRNPETQPSAGPLPEYLQPLVQELNPASETALEHSHGSVHNTLGAPSLPTQHKPLGGSSDDERLRKKRRHGAPSSRTRISRRAEPQQNKIDTQESAIDVLYDASTDSDDADESPDIHSSRSVGSKLQEIQRAVATVKQLSRTLGIKASNATNELERLKKKVERRAKAEEEKLADIGPLHRAAFQGDTRLLESLIRHGADVNDRGGTGFTALHLAAEFDRFEALQFLLLQGGVDLDATDQYGCTALMCAVRADSLRSSLLLVRSNASIDICSNDGLTALHRACGRGNMQSLVTLLLATTTKLNSKDEAKRTPLHWALGLQNWDYVLPLINAGADLNAQDEDGQTPMHIACFQAPAELLMKMIEKDVDLSIKTNQDKTVLHILCQRDICEVTQAVLERPNIDINAKDIYGRTPLIVAAGNKSVATLKLLVRHGADQTMQDYDLETALTMAIRNRYDEIVDFLIENGSPVNSQKQSRVRYRAELEQNRRAREAESVWTMTANRSIGTSQWPQPSKASVRFPKTSDQSLQSVQPLLNQAVTQAVNQVLATHLNFADTGGSHIAHGATMASNPFPGPPNVSPMNNLVNLDWLSGGDNSNEWRMQP